MDQDLIENFRHADYLFRLWDMPDNYNIKRNQLTILYCVAIYNLRYLIDILDCCHRKLTFVGEGFPVEHSFSTMKS